MEPGASSGPRLPKKVRLACERCRDRRIKCDGKVPACENCSKAQVPCIDVDSRTSAGRISRAFQLNAAARIEWLEDIIRSRLPDVDLSAGPQLLQADSSQSGSAIASASSGALEASNRFQDQAQPSSLSIGQNRGIKRSHTAASQDNAAGASIEQSARAMALHLGLLSLDVNSSQVHYLGSSSGSLFTPMLQANDESSNPLFGEPPHELALRDGTYDAFDVYDQLEESQTGNEHMNKVRRLYDVLRQELPSRKDCIHLTNLFFRHHHPQYPLLHRPTFESMTDALYKCASSPKETTLQFNGWPASQEWFPCNGEEPRNDTSRHVSISVFAAAAQLFLVFGIAANLKTQKREYQHDPVKFYEVATTALDSAVGKISMPALQILLLLVLRSFTSTERSNTWATIHLGMAFAVELGLHRDISGSNSFPEAAVQMRRRVFYCMYSLERRLSAIQGRPLGFSDDTLDTSLPELIQYGSSDLQTLADQACLPFSIHYFKMARIVSRIKHNFYLLQKRSDPQTNAGLRLLQDEIRAELDAWDDESARVMHCVPRQEKTLLSTKLKIEYHATMCLLYQPSQTFVRPDEASLQRCFRHSVERLRLYGALYDGDALFFSWRNIHGIFLAGATVLYCLWASPAIQAANSFSKLAGDVGACSNLLSAAGEWWPLVRRARASFERLASRTLQALMDKPARLSSSLSSSTPSSFSRPSAPTPPAPAAAARGVRQQAVNPNPNLDPQLCSGSPPASNPTEQPQPFRTADELEMESILNAVLQGETQLPDMLEDLGGIAHGADGFPDLWNELILQQPDFGAHAEQQSGGGDQHAFASATQQARSESRDLNRYLDSQP